MKDRTKEIIKDGFGCLVSNASALRGAKAGPLWLTIVMFFLAIILPVIPVLVSQAQINGSSFLNANSFGLEKYVTCMAVDLKENRNVEFSIDDKHTISATENGANVDFASYGSATPFATYQNSVTNEYDFVLYLSDATTDKEKSNVNNAIVATSYKNGSIDKADATAVIDTYIPSYMILFKNGVFVSIYGKQTTKAIANSSNGDFKTVKPNNECLKTLLTVNDKDGNPVVSSFDNDNWKINDDFLSGVYKNYKKFLNASYDTLKIKNVWVTSAIYLGIFFGVSVLMGFLMWLLTRGKNNPNNYFSPWLTMKIQARLSLAPGIIAAIAGIFLTSQVPLFFILTIGLRVMWISMKELRPVQ